MKPIILILFAFVSVTCFSQYNPNTNFLDGKAPMANIAVGYSALQNSTISSHCTAIGATTLGGSYAGNTSIETYPYGGDWANYHYVRTYKKLVTYHVYDKVTSNYCNVIYCRMIDSRTKKLTNWFVYHVSFKGEEIPLQSIIQYK